MTQTPQSPRDWQKDMQRVKDAHHARTCVNQPFPRLAWQEMLPDPWEDVVEHWLQEAKKWRERYEQRPTFELLEAAQSLYEHHNSRAAAAEEECRYQKGVTEDYAKGYRLQELRATAAEAREQRLKVAIECAIEEYGLWKDKGRAVEVMITELKRELSTLYPDTPAPTFKEEN